MKKFLFFLLYITRLLSKEELKTINDIPVYYKYDDKNRVCEIKTSNNTIHYQYEYGEDLEPIKIIDKINNTEIIRTFSNNFFKETSFYYHIQKSYLNNNLHQLSINDISIIYRYENNTLINIASYKKGKLLNTYNLKNTQIPIDLIQNIQTPSQNLCQNLTYHYDELNRLDTITFENKDKLYFQYDGLNRRISKTYFQFNQGLLQKQYTHFFIYDNYDEIGVIDEKGNILNIAHKDMDKIYAIETAQEIYKPLYDFRGYIYALLSKNNKIKEIYYYTPEKNTLDENFSPSKSISYWGYNSKNIDPETNLAFHEIKEKNKEQLSIHIELQKLINYCFRKSASISLQICSSLQYLNKNSKFFETLSESLKLFYNPLENMPYLSTLKPLGSPNVKIRLGYLNGMNNFTPQECIDAGYSIINKSNKNLMLDLYYLPSHGFSLDLIECFLLDSNIETPNVVEFKKLLKENLKKVPQDGKYILFVHSKSAKIANMTIPYLTEEEKNKLEIYASAPLEFITKDTCSSVTNVISKYDGIILLNILGLYLAYTTSDFNVEWIDPEDWIFPLDHKYASISYQKRLKKQIDDITKRLSDN